MTPRAASPGGGDSLATLCPGGAAVHRRGRCACDGGYRRRTRRHPAAHPAARPAGARDTRRTRPRRTRRRAGRRARRRPAARRRRRAPPAHPARRARRRCMHGGPQGRWKRGVLRGCPRYITSARLDHSRLGLHPQDRPDCWYTGDRAREGLGLGLDDCGLYPVVHVRIPYRHSNTGLINNQSTSTMNLAEDRGSYGWLLPEEHS